MILLFNVNYFANEYYLSSSNGSDSNSGTSQQNAWKSLTKLSTVSLLPGDIVRFKSGDTFTGYYDLNYGGVKGNVISFDSYGSGEKPLFNGNFTQSYIIKVKKNLKYININNLYFKNCDAITYNGKGLIFIDNDCSYINITDCKFDHTGAKQTSLDYAAVFSRDISYFTFKYNEVTGRIQGLNFIFDYTDHSDVHHINITNNNFHDLLAAYSRGNAVKFRPYLTRGQNAGIRGNWNFEGIVHDVAFDSNTVNRISCWGFKIEENDTAEIHGIFNYNINVRHNTFDYTEDCAMDIAVTRDRNGYANWSEWSYNKISNCGFDSVGNRTSSYPANAIQSHSPRHVKIQNNIIKNVAANNGDGSGIIIDYNKTNNLVGDSSIISGNIVSGCKYNLNNIGQGINCFTSARNQIFSNIVYDCYYGIIIDNSQYLAGIHSNRDSIYNNIIYHNTYGIYISKSDVYTVIKNNIIVNNTAKGFRNNNNSYAIFDYNLYYNNSCDITGGNNINKSPYFKDPENRDYTVLPNSPAISAGTKPLSGSTDFIGTKWISPYSMGAFQCNTEDTLSINANIKVYLEGPYSFDNMLTSLEQNKLLPLKQPYNHQPWNYSGIEEVSKIPDDIVDWVLIELRTTAKANSCVVKRAAFLRNDGKIVDLDGKCNISFENINSGNYFVVIQHRNHLGIMSKNAIPLSNNSSLYDFTHNSESAFGANALTELGNGIYGMYAGDSDSNGIINILDYSIVGNNIFNHSYSSGDLDMNSIINVFDYKQSCKNIYASSKVPK